MPFYDRLAEEEFEAEAELVAESEQLRLDLWRTDDPPTREEQLVQELIERFECTPEEAREEAASILAEG